MAKRFGLMPTWVAWSRRGFRANSDSLCGRSSTGAMRVALPRCSAHSPIASAVGTTCCCTPPLAAAPLLFTLANVADPLLASLLVLLALAIASFYTSISGVVKAELFPTEIRALGVGFTYAVANAMFGGTAEYVALWLESSGHERWFAWYVAGMVAI